MGVTGEIERVATGAEPVGVVAAGPFARDEGILATKIAVPLSRSALVPRPRLKEQLSDRAGTRLALVVAPAGWGKTSLVGDWCRSAQEAGEQIAWLSLDAGDNDVFRLLRYVCTALDRAVAGLGEPGLAILRSGQPPNAETVLTAILNSAERYPGRIALALDDYHVIESQEVHDALTYLLDHLPPNLGLLIATRVDPPLRLARLRVRGELVEIRAHDLRFTHEEAAAFLNEVMGLALSADAVHKLEERTEGWIAGLQLAAISLRGRADREIFLDSFTGSNRYIVDYLFDEVLDRQPDEVATFLRRTSLLSRMCGPLCETMVEGAAGQEMLERLDAGNLFLIPLDDERRWFRYHHLFADVLQARLRHLEGALIPGLHVRASEWFEGEGMIEEAVEHAFSAADEPRAVRLIEAHSERRWLAGHRNTVERWIDGLPPEVIAASAELTVLRILTFLYHLRIGAVGEALVAAGRAKPPEDPAADIDVYAFARLAVFRSYYHRFMADMAAAVEWGQTALEYLPTGDAMWRRSVSMSLGLAYFEIGRLEEASEAAKDAFADGAEGTDSYVTLIAATLIGSVEEARGRLTEAERAYRMTVDYARRERMLEFPEMSLVYGGFARVAYLRGDYTAAEAFVEEGLRWDVPMCSFNCHVSRIRLALTRGDLDAAERAIALFERQATATDIPVVPVVLEAFTARSRLLRGEDVTSWLERYESRPASAIHLRFPAVDLQEFELLTWALARLARGEMTAVRERLEERLATLDAEGRFGSSVGVRAMLAGVLAMQREMERAVETLRPALVLAEAEGYAQPFTEPGRAVVPVLREAAARGIATEQVRKILAIMTEASSAEGRSANSVPAETLSYRELEVLRLVAAGLSNPQIAEHLFLSVGTVKRHVYNIFMKLDVDSRVTAISRARELGLL